MKRDTELVCFLLDLTSAGHPGPPGESHGVRGRRCRAISSDWSINPDWEPYAGRYWSFGALCSIPGPGEKQAAAFSAVFSAIPGDLERAFRFVCILSSVITLAEPGESKVKCWLLRRPSRGTALERSSSTKTFSVAPAETVTFDGSAF
ncbi:hypothetical protein SKAU_G00222230 [Synaphobranchus kaupii]|uniref:Uncharacterized protein n=1 Tax=Synaphobranchus kaupii TaxID=118154 RepID=A0A9Q1FB03_SYNKA|nr:hypothetical protein SKAU_G00222230 [Synaphobranchus kaupii]